MQTCATIVCNSKNAEEQNIICVNYVMSKREHVNLILDTCQLEQVKVEASDRPIRLVDHHNDSPPGDSDAKSGAAKGPKSPGLDAAKLRQSDVDKVEPPAPTRGRKRKAKPSEKEEIPLKVAVIDPIPPVVEERAESSVKDLENAMSKHLPATTDFSTDTLLQKQQQQDKSSSAIQWIGHNSHFQQAPMPATALLRQLYANRESVIRSSRPPGGGFYPSHDSTSTAALPTPPGSESSYESPQFGLPAVGQKPNDAFTNLVSAYGSSYPTMEYQSAMTPPSSVSPRDSAAKAHHAAAAYEAYNYANAAEMGGDSMPPLPLKPQAYSAAAAAMHHDSYDHQSQYFPHPPTGFHLYKGQGWYTTPS